VDTLNGALIGIVVLFGGAMVWLLKTTTRAFIVFLEKHTQQDYEADSRIAATIEVFMERSSAEHTHLAELINRMILTLDRISERLK
jgi:hypothetical protein